MRFRVVNESSARIVELPFVKQFWLDDGREEALNLFCMKLKCGLIGMFTLVTLAVASPRTWVLKTGETIAGDYVSSGTTMSSAGRTVVGSNLALVLNAGNTTTGDSAYAVTLTGAGTTETIPIRVIDVVPETATAADTYTELLVKINTHQYNNTTGV